MSSERATSTGTGYGSLAVRVVLTLLGAAGLIIGGLLDWISGAKGTNFPIRVLWTTDVGSEGAKFLASLGFVFIILGLIAIIGLAPRTGVLTSLAGALGMVAFILFLISLYRANLSLADLRIGAWLALVGGVLALIGGFLGARPTEVVATTGTAGTPSYTP
jgi:hypothetical protein